GRAARHQRGEASAEQGAGEARDDQEQPERRRRAGQRDLALAEEVGRHPCRQAAHAERVDDLRRGIDQVAATARQRAERGGETEGEERGGAVDSGGRGAGSGRKSRKRASMARGTPATKTGARQPWLDPTTPPTM